MTDPQFDATRNDPDVERALEAARAGETDGLGRVLESYRGRIRRMVELRIDPRLASRIDPADVVQEAFLEATARVAEYLDKRDLPFFLWVRFLAGQKILELERRHLGAQKRDVRQERHMFSRVMPGVTSVVFANAVLDRGETPSMNAARGEDRARLEHAFDEMPEMDREILALRHFEHLSNADAAQVLGISPNAASVRYVRAMKKLAEIMKTR